MQKRFSQPIMLIAYGYPGSGKTTFARQFAHEYGLLHVSADRIRYELFDDPHFNAAEEQVIISIMNYMTDQALKAGASVVYDRGVGVKKQRDTLIDSARKQGFVPLTVWIQTDIETAQYRAMNRDRRRAEDRYSFPLPQDAFDSMAKVMTRPGEKEPFVVVSGKHAFRSQAQAVLNRLQRSGVIYGQPQEQAPKPAGRVDPRLRRLRPQDVGRG